jgi:hypothetical protein
VISGLVPLSLVPIQVKLFNSDGISNLFKLFLFISKLLDCAAHINMSYAHDLELGLDLAAGLLAVIALAGVN